MLYSYNKYEPIAIMEYLSTEPNQPFNRVVVIYLDLSINRGISFSQHPYDISTVSKEKHPMFIYQYSS